MGNYKVSVNLLRLNGAFVSNLKGKATTKRCLCIPIDEAHLFLGEKGCYLNLNAWETREESPYGDTHYLKQRFSKEVGDAMTEEQRRAIPIVGNMKPKQGYGPDGQPVQTQQPAPQPATVTEQQQQHDELPQRDDDLPF